MSQSDIKKTVENIESKEIPVAYSFNVTTPNQLIEIMNEQKVYLPMDININQMAHIRFVILTHRLHQIPFDIVKVENDWYIDKVVHHVLKSYLKQGDRLLVINKTMISNQLNEIDIFKLMLHSSVPFVVWVTWDIDTYLKYRTLFRQCEYEDAYIYAKTYLLQTHLSDDISLYDQLAAIIADTIQNSYCNINDLFENLNQILYYPTEYSYLREPKNNYKLTTVKLHAQLLKGKEQDLLRSRDYVITGVPHLKEIAYYCSSAGYGIHYEEIVLIWSAMKRLNDEIQCTEMKFWGKIFGLFCDYYVIQIQHEREIVFDEFDISHRPAKKKRTSATANISSPDLSFEIPIEPRGMGTNQFTYFVTNSPGLPWIKLPDVIPKMITYARKVRHLFTGCLSSQMHAFPPFPGSEKDYLRAQIARITATTHISPTGFYILADREQEEYEDIDLIDRQKDIIINPEYNNDSMNLMTVELLADQNLQEWVHSLPEILPQGRTRFWRSSSPAKTSFVKNESDEEEEEEEEISDHHMIEIPAPLLQPIADDKFLDENQPPWSIGLTMSIMHEYSLCFVRSNVWPGAFTLGHAGNFLNLYVGWGQKYERFNPAQPSIPEIEFMGEFTEDDDPTVERENAILKTVNDLDSYVTSEESVSEEEENDDEYMSTEEEH